MSQERYIFRFPPTNFVEEKANMADISIGNTNVLYSIQYPGCMPGQFKVFKWLEERLNTAPTGIPNAEVLGCIASYLGRRVPLKWETQNEIFLYRQKLKKATTQADYARIAAELGSYCLARFRDDVENTQFPHFADPFNDDTFLTPSGNSYSEENYGA